MRWEFLEELLDDPGVLSGPIDALAEIMFRLEKQGLLPAWLEAVVRLDLRAEADVIFRWSLAVGKGLVSRFTIDHSEGLDFLFASVFPQQGANVATVQEETGNRQTS